MITLIMNIVMLYGNTNNNNDNNHIDNDTDSARTIRAEAVVPEARRPAEAKWEYYYHYYLLLYYNN